MFQGGTTLDMRDSTRLTVIACAIFAVAACASGKAAAQDMPEQGDFDCYYQQKPDYKRDDSAVLSSIPAGTLIFDNFEGTGEPIGTVVWYALGANLIGTNLLECSLEDTLFEVSLYEDDRGRPANILIDETVPAEIEDTGFDVVFLDQTFSVLELTATLVNKLSFNKGWVSVGQIGGFGCNLYWMASPQGDKRSFRAIQGFLQEEYFDVAFCVGSEPVDLTDELAEKAKVLLAQFGEADTNKSNTLGISEAQFTGVGLFRSQFNELDLSGDNQLRVAELLARTGPGIVHQADVSGDRALQLVEVLRIVQLYNGGGYACAPTPGDTEDGYEIAFRGGRGQDTRCHAHTADYLGGADGRISLSELLRVLQFYNAGGMAYCPEDGEDGFCAVSPEAEGAAR